MKKTVVLSAVLLLLVCMVSVSLAADRIKIGIWPGWVFASGILKLAQDKGFIAAEGLEAEFAGIERDDVMILALASKSVQVIPTVASGVPFAIQQGAPLISVMITTIPDAFLVVPKGTTLEGLKGKKVATLGDLTTTDKLLSTMDLGFGEMLPFDLSPARVGALVAGHVQGAVVSAVHAAKLLDTGNYDIVLYPSQIGKVPVYGLTVRREDAREEWTIKLTRAVKATVAWWLDNPYYAVSYLEDKVRIPHSQAQILYSLLKPIIVRDGVMSEKDISNGLKRMGVTITSDKQFDFWSVAR